MKKIIGSAVLVILAVFLIRGFWDSQLTPVSSEKETKSFVITKGGSFSEVSKKLSDEGLIKSSFFFTFFAKQSGLSDKIQSGTFKLSPSMSAEEILKTITGNPVDDWVTLLEGWRIEEMAEKLNSEFRIQNSEFLKIAKEGYMFPDTYLFPKDYSAEQIAKIMMDNFEKKYTEALRTKIKSLGLSEDQGVILASIVEREARSYEARRMVASILLKRLKIGMGLNADATVQYATGYQPQEKSWWKRHLTKEDLRVESHYNTYIYSGLPPTPIANPSLSSLQAVADADLSIPYLYYYHDSKGNSYYAKTLDEHNQNIANNP
ncbi:endolytic transglycosylase MltG [Candidatus Daviesbacteria bacterium]|nr:endolytic transglycosylase MltG [Candidatus Daviesbacteria bacterium]